MGSLSDSEEAQRLQIPRIDFRGLDLALALARSSSPEWAAARHEAAAALRRHRCFEAVYGGAGEDLKGPLMGLAAPELFALPLEAKARNASDQPYLGYIGNIPGMAYESLRVADAADLPSVDKFARLLWPQGNPSFCDIVWTYAKRMQELERMVERMILESLGLEKYFQSHVESLEYAVRLSEYGVPLDRDTKIALQSHVDPNMITIVGQHEVGGLEVQAEDGSWIAIEPSPDSFVVMTGEAFTVWTNGRLPPCPHRVRITCEKKRYSALFGSRPKAGCIVRVPEELVDDEHPLLYKPCDYNEYIKFRFSEEGRKVKDTLTAFSGVGKEEIAT